jgi:hypothetical protein
MGESQFGSEVLGVKIFVFNSGTPSGSVGRESEFSWFGERGDP